MPVVPPSRPSVYFAKEDVRKVNDAIAWAVGNIKKTKKGRNSLSLRLHGVLKDEMFVFCQDGKSVPPLLPAKYVSSLTAFVEILTEMCMNFILHQGEEIDLTKKDMYLELQRKALDMEKSMMSILERK